MLRRADHSHSEIFLTFKVVRSSMWKLEESYNWLCYYIIISSNVFFRNVILPKCFMVYHNSNSSTLLVIYIREYYFIFSKMWITDSTFFPYYFVSLSPAVSMETKKILVIRFTRNMFKVVFQAISKRDLLLPLTME